MNFLDKIQTKIATNKAHLITAGDIQKLLDMYITQAGRIAMLEHAVKHANNTILGAAAHLEAGSKARVVIEILRRKD